VNNPAAMCNTKPLCFEYADHPGEVLLLLAIVTVSPATDISAKFNNTNMIDTQVGASIGISVYPEHGNDKELLLIKADDVMYLAKREGKNDCRMSEI